MNKDLESRISALERENRRWKVLGLFLFLGAAGAAGSLNADNSSDILRAKAFQLVDKAGIVRGELKSEDDGRPGLYFRDQDGKQRFTIGMFAAGNPMIYMVADDGETAQVSRAPGGKSFFRVRNKKQEVLWEKP